MKYDVIVVGGGPAGCKAAGLIAGRGFKVLVAEEHERIGEPVKCAGLVSPRTLKAAAVPDEIIINQIHGAYIHSPGGETLTVRGPKEYALVVDRAVFDRKISEQARQAGAEVLTGTRAAVEDFPPSGVNVKLKARGKEVSAGARLLIGADGTNSRIARRVNIPGPEEVVRMYAAEVELKCPDLDMAHIFLGRDIAPGWFGWLIPVAAGRARAGVGVSGGAKHPRSAFKAMIAAYPGIFKDLEIIRYTGGIVPIGFPARIYGEKTMLVGDAACQTKPISGGGLYLGMLGAELCARVAAGALQKGDFSPESLSEYQRLWEKEMAGEIAAAFAHRDIFLTMTDKEMDVLIRFFNRPLWQNIIARYGDIDYPSWLGGKLFFAKPWAEKFLISGLKKVLGYCSSGKLL